jgi:hypothetical protein
MYGFNSVSCVNDFSDFTRILEKCRSISPVVSPNSDCQRILFIPSLFEFIKPQKISFFSRGQSKLALILA